MADCESSREGNEDSKATRRNSLKRAGRTTYPRKELPISMKLPWSGELMWIRHLGGQMRGRLG